MVCAYDCDNMSDVTRLIEGVERGEPHAADELLPLVYEELRRLAAHKMAAERPGQTLQATALVHEAWLRLVGEKHDWLNRKHFFSAAAEAMRRILVDRARRRNRFCHGGDMVRVSLEDIDVAVESAPETTLFINEALERLGAEDPVVAELIKLRFFAGIPNSEAAALLGLSERTARRAWAYARAWLADALRREASSPS
jgi:RNA polymerase sigma factor (TIGR02999 family)